MPTLFDYQQDGVADIDQAYASGHVAPLYVLSTGGGKTMTFSYIAARRWADKGYRVLMLGHRRELISQMSDTLRLWDCPHGIVKPDARLTSHAVQVGMVQTLANRVKLDRSGRYKFDLVIIDEAHHAVKDSTWGAVISHNAGAKLLGVTATPCRLDGKGLGVHSNGFFDSMIIGPTMNELIARGQLVRPVVYAPKQQINLSGVKKRNGDFVISALAGAMDLAPITGNAVDEYRQRCHNRSAIAFTVNVEHASHVCDAFKAAGYQAAMLDGYTLTAERKRMIKDLGNGSLHILSSCNVVSEGTDIPSVFAAILLRPTESWTLCMQQIGRALRSAPGKDRAIINDHVDNVRRHGLPTDEMDFSLDGARVKKLSSTTPPTKICKACRARISSAAMRCPECGEVVEKGDVERTVLMSRPGVLEEQTPEMIAATRKIKRREIGECRTKAQLITLGISRNYKNPEYWADCILRDRAQMADKYGVKQYAYG